MDRVVALMLLGASLLPLLAGPAAGVTGPAQAGARARGTDLRYRVRPGETLWEIARRYGTSVQALATANGITDVNVVVSGRWLMLPATGRPSRLAVASTSRPARPRAVAAPAPIHYSVQIGDTLASISRRYSSSVPAIAAANGIADPNLIVVGRRLVIPAAAERRSASGAKAVPSRSTTSRKPSRWSPAITTAGHTHPRALTGARLVLTSRFEHWAAQYGISPSLLKALCYFESGWHRSAVSPVGAVGIGQLMPDTAAFVSKQLLGRTLDRHDPDDNIRMSARYLRWLLDNSRWDVRRAVGSYYQGLRAMQRHGPYAETVAYVDLVLALRSRF